MPLPNLKEKFYSVFPKLEGISVQSAFDALERFSPRERNIIMGTAGLLIISLVFSVVNASYKSNRRLKTQLDGYNKILTQIQSESEVMSRRAQDNNMLRSRIRGIPGGFYLSSLLERKAALLGVAVNSVSSDIRQDLGGDIEEVSAEARISAISFPRLLTLLTDLEKSTDTLIRLKLLKIKIIPGDPKNVETTFKVSAYVLKQS